MSERSHQKRGEDNLLYSTNTKWRQGRARSLPRVPVCTVTVRSSLAETSKFTSDFSQGIVHVYLFGTSTELPTVSLCIRVILQQKRQEIVCQKVLKKYRSSLTAEL